MTREKRLYIILQEYGMPDPPYAMIEKIMAMFESDDIVRRYEAGETVSSIAKSLGMSRAGVKYRVRRFSPPATPQPNYIAGADPIKDWKETILESIPAENETPIPDWVHVNIEDIVAGEQKPPREVQEYDVRGHLNIFLDGEAPPLPLNRDQITMNLFSDGEWYEGVTWSAGEYIHVFSRDIEKVKLKLDELC